MSMQVETVEQAASAGAGTPVAKAVEEREQRPPVSVPAVDRWLVASLVEGTRSQGLSVEGEGGLFPELTRLVLESALEGEIHMGSVLLDTLADAAAGAGVLIAGTVIWAGGGLYWLDPVVALLVAVVVGVAGARLAAQATAALRGADAGFGDG